MQLSLRTRLMAVTLLALAACVAALVTIVTLTRTGERQRIERATELVTHEVERLQDRPMALRPVRFMRRGFRGLMSGVLATHTLAPQPLGFEVPAPLRALRDEAVHEATRTRSIVVRVLALPSLRLRRRDAEQPDGGSAVLAVGPLPGGSVAWALTWVPTPREERFARLGVFALCVLTLLLVVASLRAMLFVRSGVSTLRRSLDALARDLAATIDRPTVTEFAEVSDGITSLARALRNALTERTQLTAALAERERLASLGRVAAGVAHEVRNPMAAIKLRVDMARQSVLSAKPDLAGVSADLAEVADELSRLDRLVADLLVVAGRRVAEPRDTNLRALVDARTRACESLAREQGLRFDVRGEAHAEVDADRVIRALDNLLRNAVEASPRGAVVQVALAHEGNSATVQVRDEGTGVAPEHHAALFEPFFSTRPGGTGLGLALSRAVAASHGGTLTYAREGQRTVFTLAFPVHHRGDGATP